MLLPDIPDLAISKRGKLRFGECCDVLILVVYRPTGSGIESTDKVEKSTLTRSAFTYDSDLLTLRNLQIKIAKNHEIFIAGSINLGEFFDSDQRLWGQAPVYRY